VLLLTDSSSLSLKKTKETMVIETAVPVTEDKTSIVVETVKTERTTSEGTEVFEKLTLDIAEEPVRRDQHWAR
jgi:hypothetical protein